MNGDILGYLTKISEPLPMGAVSIGGIFFAAYWVATEALTTLFGGLVIFSILIITIAVCINDVKRGSPAKKYETKSTNMEINLSKDLRVKGNIWEKIEPIFINIGFNYGKRTVSELLINKRYEFSLANGITSLFIVQLKPEELTISTISYLNTMKLILEDIRRCTVEKIVIICDKQEIDDGLINFVEGRDDLALLTNYSIRQLDKREVGEIHLKHKLGL